MLFPIWGGHTKYMTEAQRTQGFRNPEHEKAEVSKLRLI
jgi:hypothetical protein